MEQDEKLAIDESDRAERYQAVKRDARQEMQAEIASQAPDERQRSEAAAVGERLKDKSIRELAETDAEIERGRGAARVSQVVDYIFFVIYGLIGLEILLELLGARESNAFKNLIDTVSAPLLAPFNTLMPDLSSGRFQFKFSYVMALIVYMLLHLAVNGILRMLAHRKTAI
ncbi:MAG TPA: hypothetical protein VG778_07085 [Blastocatellia bacterium]|jgi:uncharacterized protein YggT (Ycf19 family)|nr:hypothetical protein [Blastocatellia bacterium]